MCVNRVCSAALLNLAYQHTSVNFGSLTHSHRSDNCHRAISLKQTTPSFAVCHDGVAKEGVMLVVLPLEVGGTIYEVNRRDMSIIARFVCGVKFLGHNQYIHKTGVTVYT